MDGPDVQSYKINAVRWCEANGVIRPYGRSGYLYRGILYADEKRNMIADETRPYYAISVAFSFPVFGRQGRIATSSWLL